MRQIDSIIIHCSATLTGRHFGIAEIERWHTLPPPRGNGWKAIGYHYVIEVDGTIQSGRRIEEAGAHVKGHNSRSVGICLVGGIDENQRPSASFTNQQWDSLTTLLKGLRTSFPAALIRGHNDYTNAKACPSFDVRSWCDANGIDPR